MLNTYPSDCPPSDLSSRLNYCYSLFQTQVVLVLKNPPVNAGDIKEAGLILASGRFPWRRAWPPTPIFLPGESHRQRSYSHRVTKGQTQLKWLHVHALARQDVETYRPLFSLTNMSWIPITCQAVCWGLKAFLSRVPFISDPSLKAAYFSSSWLLAGLDGANEVKP